MIQKVEKGRSPGLNKNLNEQNIPGKFFSVEQDKK